MRELVLNHASVATSDLETATLWLKQLAISLMSLKRRGIGKSELRMARHLFEIKCTDSATMYDALLTLRNIGARDEYLYLCRMSSKAPLLESVGEGVMDRFTRCEATGVEAATMSPEDGAPLLYCAIADGIAVGFPSDPVWEQDQIKVYFEELSTDGDELGEVSETIDNLTRLEHAETISERHIADMRDVSNFGELWERRTEIFPNLCFGPDVRRHLTRINHSALSSVLKRLSGLDDWVKDWRASDSMPSQWPSKTTDESTSVYQDASLRERRRFASQKGSSKLFMRHSRFGDGRIHFRVDTNSREIEIGYIGTKLPTRDFR